MRWALLQIGRQNPEQLDTVRKALLVSSNPSLRNPERTRFWRTHPVLWTFYGRLPLDAEADLPSPRLPAGTQAS